MVYQTNTQNPKTLLKLKPRKISPSGRERLVLPWKKFICRVFDSFNKSGEIDNPDSFVYYQHFSFGFLGINSFTSFVTAFTSTSESETVRSLYKLHTLHKTFAFIY